MRFLRLLPILLIVPLGFSLAQTKPPATAQQRVNNVGVEPPGPSVPGSQPPPVPQPGPPTPGAGNGNGQVQQMAQQAAAVEENPDWAVTLERIASSVVSIEVDSTR